MFAREGAKIAHNFLTYGLCNCLDECFVGADAGDYNTFCPQRALNRAGFLGDFNVWLGGGPALDIATKERKSVQTVFERRAWAALFLAEWLETSAGKHLNRKLTVQAALGNETKCSKLVQAHLKAVRGE